MAELKSKKEMTDAIAKAFVFNKKADTLFVTPDGQCFVEKHFANFHAGKNKGFKVSTEERRNYTDAIGEMDKANQAAIAEKTKTGTDANADPKYGKLKLDELKAECTKRTISFEEGAIKKDLVALLEADDTKKASAASTEGK